MSVVAKQVLVLALASGLGAAGCESAGASESGVPSGDGGVGAGNGNGLEAGSSSGNDASAADGGPPGPAVQTCTGTSKTTLPANAPALVPGVWTNLSPPSVKSHLGDPQYVIAQGVTMDPCDHGILYWTNTPFAEGAAGLGGIYKSTDAGATWSRLGDTSIANNPPGHATFLDMPLHLRIDPTDSLHMYAGDGVRGGTTGFWVSHDGGATWDKPAGWSKAATEPGAGFIDDVYDVGVDPTDFDHVLVSSHSPWNASTNAAGVLETKDGGKTWTVHLPEPSWGAGHSIAFLYDPTKGIGDAQTWLLGTQGDGYWRTTNSGASWQRAATSSIFHGGGSIYYGLGGVLYASSVDGTLRSANNGQSFENAGSGAGNTGIIGDGTLLYTAPAYGFGAKPFVTSPESDGRTWSPSPQNIEGSGPFEMTLDPVNHIVYAAMWFQGVWALKIGP
jgi:hypothetical protein